MSAEVPVRGRLPCRHGAARLRGCMGCGEAPFWRAAPLSRIISRRSSRGIAACGRSRCRGQRSAPARSRPRLILPLSAPAMPDVAGQAMRNAAEMALAEFNARQYPAPGEGRRRHARGGAARRGTGARRRRRDHSRAAVRAVGQRRRPGRAGAQYPGHRVFDRHQCRVARHLSVQLPAGNRCRRIVQYATSTGKRSYAALIPDNPYGTVVEAAFRQDVARRGGQVVALERYPTTRRPWRRRSRRRSGGGARRCLVHSGQRRRGPGRGPGARRRRRQYQENPAARHRPVGRPAHPSRTALDGGWYAAPDAAGYRNFVSRYSARYKQEPVRTATLAYDAVALVAALVKTQGRAAVLARG